MYLLRDGGRVKNEKLNMLVRFFSFFLGKSQHGQSEAVLDQYEPGCLRNMANGKTRIPAQEDRHGRAGRTAHA